MSKIVWDADGTRFYEMGTDRGVLYKKDELGKYINGVAWNGLTGITQSPSGADETKLFADNIKYGSLLAAEEFGGTIEAYTYPDEWASCDGSLELMPGVSVGQQGRDTFGLSYRTLLGNDISPDIGYKIHLIYGGKAAPSEKAYSTVNDSPEAITFSWELTTTPVAVKDAKPTAIMSIDSTKISKDALIAIETILYGDDSVSARLPLPDEVVAIIEVL